MALKSEAEELLAKHLDELRVEYVRQWRFFSERRWKLDFYLGEHSIGIEIQGMTWANGRHTRGAGYQADCEKANYATMLGIRLLRFTTEDVNQGRAKEFLRLWLGVEPKYAR